MIFVWFVPFLVFTDCKTRNEKSKKSLSSDNETVSSSNPVLNISIHQAALDGQISQVKNLLTTGVDVNSVDEDGRTPLM